MPYTGCGLNHSTSTWRGPGRLAKRQNLKTSESRNQAPKNSANPTSIRYGVGLRSHFEKRYVNMLHAPISPADVAGLPSAIADAGARCEKQTGHYSRQDAGNLILPSGSFDGSCASIFASGTLSPRRFRISSVHELSTSSFGSSAIGSTLISCRNATCSFIMFLTSSLMP